VTTTRSSAPTSARSHRIEWGDTWYAIAQQYGVTAAALQAANPEVDPSRLRSGEVLRVPAAGRAAAGRSHRVEPGESLWGIARRYGVSTEEIRKANGLEGDRVRIGETLVIPGGE
jgi:membrane-bound lytic murein transglycosylase D